MISHKAEAPAGCFVFIHATPGQRIGLLQRGKAGFRILPVDPRELSEREVKVLVNALNSARGITPAIAEEMLQQCVYSGVAANSDRMAA